MVDNFNSTPIHNCLDISKPSNSDMIRAISLGNPIALLHYITSTSDKVSINDIERICKDWRLI